MKSIVLLFWILVTALPAVPAQVEYLSNDYFPTDQEFFELQKVASEVTYEGPARLLQLPDGQLFKELGFRKYARRVYSLAGSGSLSIEVFTLLDDRAAYSALTLLRSSNIQTGPPGDAFTSTEDGIRFVQGKEWIRIQGKGVPEDLIKQVAGSISNKIGPREGKPPSLVSHLPKTGYDAASLRYFPVAKAFELFYGAEVSSAPFRPNSDMEIAQAHYNLDNHTGSLYLLSFPTSEVAEEYFAGLTGTESGKNTNKIYTKRAGPLVGILTGSYDPVTADKVLKGIQYKYSLRWVYEKEKPKTVWGIPAGILGTVVKSFFFVVILCVASIILGIGFAFVRRWIKLKRSPDQPNENDITRLRLK